MGVMGIQGAPAVARPASAARAHAARQAEESTFGGFPIPDLGNLPLPDLGDLPLPDLGSLPRPDLGSLPRPDLGKLPLPDLGNLPVPSAGHMPVDLKVNRSGDIVATTSFLGLMPVKVTFDPEDVLAGRYGRQVTLQMTNPGKASVTGDMHVDALAIPAFEVPDHGIGQAFRSLEFVVAADHQIHVTGVLRVGPFEVPFQADARPTRTANGLYDVAVSNVWMFGSWPVPAWLATWLTASVVSWVTPLDGFGRPASDRLALDLRSVLNGEPSRVAQA